MNSSTTNKIIAVILTLSSFILTGCPGETPSSDEVQAAAQETLMKEGTAQTGMPAIKNFRERKFLKLVYELRDQESLTTYTYLVAQATGKLSLLCESIGYAVSDATGYTNPVRIHESRTNVGYAIMPQPEPNGLFTPDASNANWVMCVSPSGKASPVMVQSDVVVLPYKQP